MARKQSQEVIDGRDDAAAGPAAEPVEAVETEAVQPTTENDRLAWFRDADRRVKLGFYTMMLAISEIYENKLYLAAGFCTIKDYLTTVDVSRTQFYLCVRTQKYLQSANIHSEDILSSPGEVGKDKQSLVNSPKKMDVLSQNIDPELFKELFDGKQIDAEGGALDLKEIVEMSVVELKRQFADRDRKRRGEMAQLREEYKQLKSEYASDMRLVDRAREDLRRAEMLKVEWAPMEKSVSDRLIALRTTVDYIDRCTRLLKDVTVGEEEDQRIETEAIHMIGAVNYLWGIVQIHFAWVSNKYELGYDPGKLQGAEALPPDWQKYVPSEIAKMDFEIEAEEAAAREAEKLSNRVKMTVKRKGDIEATNDDEENS